MASTTLQYRVTANISAAVSGFSQLAQRIEQSNKRINKSIDATFGKNAIRMSQNLLSSLKYAAAGLTALGVAAVKMSADFQVAQKSMTVLTGSAETARKHLSDLERFAATTPFEFSGLVDASKRLQAYGFQAEAVIPILNNVGNAAAALGLGQEGIDRITLALGQMASKGKVSAEEMLQLTETGIAGWQMLADYTGQSVAEVQEQASKGAISAQTALEAIFTGMRDRFDGIMEESADEIPYQLSNMQDSISSIMRSIGDSITEELDLKSKMSDVSIYLTALSQEIKTSGVREAFKTLVPPEVQGAIAGVATAITVMLIPALAKLGVAMLAAGGPFTVVAGVAAAAAYVIVTKWDELGKFFEDLKDRIAGFFNFLARKGEEASVRVGKVADNVKMDFSGLFSSNGAAVRGGLNLVPESKSRPSVMEQARQIAQKYSAELTIENDPTKFLAGSIGATSGGASASAAAIKAAAREAEKAAKEQIKLDAENADRVLARIEKQKEAARELSEVYERADREYLSGLSWENSQGLLSNSDYFDILNQRVEELGLKVKDAFNMTDAEKALFGETQQAALQVFNDRLKELDETLQSGNLRAYNEEVQKLVAGFGGLPLVTQAAGDAMDEAAKKNRGAIINLNEITTEWISKFQDGVASAIVSGENLGDVLSNIGKELLQLSLKMALFGQDGKSGMFGGMFSWVGGLFGTMHDGGRVGDFSGTRMVDPSVFDNAPRFHDGGFVGLRPNEVPAILEAGETVISKDGKLTMSGERSAPSVVINVENKSGTDVDAQQTSVGFDGENWVIGVVLNAIQTNKRGMRTMLKGVRTA